MCRCTDSSTAAPLSTASGSNRATSSHRTLVPPVRLRVLVEEVAQLLAAPVQAHLGRGHRDPELLGDLLVTQAVDVLEHHEHPELRGQLLDGTGSPGNIGRLLRGLFGRAPDAVSA